MTSVIHILLTNMRTLEAEESLRNPGVPPVLKVHGKEQCAPGQSKKIPQVVRTAPTVMQVDLIILCLWSVDVHVAKHGLHLSIHSFADHCPKKVDKEELL
eukprot:scpid106708/ scgid22685/ 